MRAVGRQRRGKDRLRPLQDGEWIGEGAHPVGGRAGVIRLDKRGCQPTRRDAPRAPRQKHTPCYVAPPTPQTPPPDSPGANRNRTRRANTTAARGTVPRAFQRWALPLLGRLPPLYPHLTWVHDVMLHMHKQVCARTAEFCDFEVTVTSGV